MPWLWAPQRTAVKRWKFGATRGRRCAVQYVIFCVSLRACSIQRATSFTEGRNWTSLRLRIRLRHGLGQLARIAVFQFLDRIHPDLAEQPGIFFAHPFDAQFVGNVGPNAAMSFHQC